MHNEYESSAKYDPDDINWLEGSFHSGCQVLKDSRMIARGPSNPSFSYPLFV